MRRTVLAFALLAAAVVACRARDDAPSPEASSASAATSSAPPPPASSAESLGVTVLAQGTGNPAKAGDKVSVLYEGTLADGTKYDPSHDRNKPLVFRIGERGVIKGMSEGVTGMRVGEMRRIVVPPSLAFGERSNATIPPHATLVFEVEMKSIEPR